MKDWRLLIIAIYAEEHIGFCNLCAVKTFVTHSARILKDDRHVIDLDLCAEHAKQISKLERA